jgi:NAD-dependent dihydropyrimidine dehydrogenase PreA subunit
VKALITYYGYTDGSGEYFVIIDSKKCNGCGRCIEQCPKAALHLKTMFIDLEDKTVAAVKEEHRNKIKYTCAGCKPEKNLSPCVVSCSAGAVKCISVVR